MAPVLATSLRSLKRRLPLSAEWAKRKAEGWRAKEALFARATDVAIILQKLAENRELLELGEYRRLASTPNRKLSPREKGELHAYATILGHEAFFGKRKAVSVFSEVNKRIRDFDRELLLINVAAAFRRHMLHFQGKSERAGRQAALYEKLSQLKNAKARLRHMRAALQKGI